MKTILFDTENEAIDFLYFLWDNFNVYTSCKEFEWIHHSFVYMVDIPEFVLNFCDNLEVLND